MKTLIAAALLLALVSPAYADLLSLKICLDGWDKLDAQETKRALKEDKDGLPRRIHCEIARRALVKHRLWPPTPAPDNAQ